MIHSSSALYSSLKCIRFTHNFPSMSIPCKLLFTVMDTLVLLLHMIIDYIIVVGNCMIINLPVMLLCT